MMLICGIPGGFYSRARYLASLEGIEWFGTGACLVICLLLAVSALIVAHIAGVAARTAGALTVTVVFSFFVSSAALITIYETTRECSSPIANVSCEELDKMDLPPEQR